MSKPLKTVTLDNVEIFKVGTWNGDTYTHQNLEEMVRNFQFLKDSVKPPLKLGHNEDQALLHSDGLPAAGWITNIKKAGDAIVATINNVPKKLADIIKSSGYKRVSSEIYPEYNVENKTFKNVLRAVALLGEDTPAVSSLKDVVALYKIDNDLEYKVYSLETKEGEQKMTKIIKLDEETKKAIANGIKDAFADFADDSNKVTPDGSPQDQPIGDKSGEPVQLEEEDKKEEEKKKEEKKDEFEEAEKKKDDEDEAEKMTAKEWSEMSEAEKLDYVKELEEAVDDADDKLEKSEMTQAHLMSESKKKDIKAFTLKVVEEGRLLPKHKNLIANILFQANNDTVLKYTEDGKTEKVGLYKAIKKFIGEMPEVLKFAEISKDGSSVVLKTEHRSSDGTVYPIKDAELDVRVKKYAETHNVGYEQALITVSKENK